MCGRRPRVFQRRCALLPCFVAAERLFMFFLLIKFKKKQQQNDFRLYLYQPVFFFAEFLLLLNKKTNRRSSKRLEIQRVGLETGGNGGTGMTDETCGKPEKKYFSFSKLISK